MTVENVLAKPINNANEGMKFGCFVLAVRFIVWIDDVLQDGGGLAAWADFVEADVVEVLYDLLL